MLGSPRTRPAVPLPALLRTLAPVLLAVALAAPLAACGSTAEPQRRDVQEAREAARSNPFRHGDPYADPGSSTARAAEEAAAAGDRRRAEILRRLAAVPQGIWLTPERLPAGAVGPYVGRVVRDAAARGRVPVLVVYGITERDCSGGHSGGGLPAAEYQDWVAQIAEAARGRHAVAVLEPDALASAAECDRREQRVAQIGEAGGTLARAGVETYLDGGHSAWLDAEEMADLLRDAGVEHVRGFATNVANDNSDEAERDYAERVSARLEGAGYVIDRGRNGAGGAGEWCNAPDQALGAEPERVDGGHQDAWLWIKPPAESDGTCHGGPPAGEVWPERAQAMAERAGW